MSTLPPVVALADLGPLRERMDGEAGGQSIGLWRLATPGLLFKHYNPDGQRNAVVRDMDRLIQLPATLAGADRELIDRWMSWPVSRVVDGDTTIGAVIRAAPEEMNVTRLTRRGTVTEVKPLEVDLMAANDDLLRKRNIDPPSAGARARMCGELARFASLLERCGIVYGDWSYANAFWHPVRHTVFLIDLDGCSFGPRAHLATANFEEPGATENDPVDQHTDRYRAALLIARMLTGRREIADVRANLARMAGEAPRLLLAATDPSTPRTHRPTLTQLRDAFLGRPAASGAVPDAGVPSQTVTGTGKPSASGVAGWHDPRTGATSGPPPASGPRPLTPTPPVEPERPFTPGGLVATLVVLALLVFLCAHLL